MERSRKSVVSGVLVVSAIAGGLTPLCAQQGARVLTLAQAVSEALLRNDRIINQHDNGEHAGLAVRAARSTFQPKLVPNVRGSFGQTDITDQSYRLDVNQRFVNGTEIRVGAGTSTAQVPSAIGLPDVRFYNT